MDEKAHYVVATAIIVKEGKFLIAKRSDNEKAFPGKWTVPGGKLEKKDYISLVPDTNAGQWYNTVEKLLKREVYEEVGLQINNFRYITSLTFIRPDGIPTFVLSFLADYFGGEVILEDSLTEYKWVTAEEAKEYDLIDGIQHELEMAEDLIENGTVGEW